MRRFSFLGATTDPHIAGCGDQLHGSRPASSAQNGGPSPLRRHSDAEDLISDPNVAAICAPQVAVIAPSTMAHSGIASPSSVTKFEEKACTLARANPENPPSKVNKRRVTTAKLNVMAVLSHLPSWMSTTYPKVLRLRIAHRLCDMKMRESNIKSAERECGFRPILFRR